MKHKKVSKIEQILSTIWSKIRGKSDKFKVKRIEKMTLQVEVDSKDAEKKIKELAKLSNEIESRYYALKKEMAKTLQEQAKNQKLAK